MVSGQPLDRVHEAAPELFARSLCVFARTGSKHQLSDGMSDVAFPVFDRDGKHLYFTASTDFGLTVGWRDMSSLARPVTRSVYVVVLRKRSPLAARTRER